MVSPATDLGDGLGMSPGVLPPPHPASFFRSPHWEEKFKYNLPLSPFHPHRIFLCSPRPLCFLFLFTPFLFFLAVFSSPPPQFSLLYFLPPQTPKLTGPLSLFSPLLSPPSFPKPQPSCLSEQRVLFCQAGARDPGMLWRWGSPWDSPGPQHWSVW